MKQFVAGCLLCFAGCLLSTARAEQAWIIDAQAYTLPSELQPTLTKSVQRYDDTLDQAVERMDTLGIARAVVMPNPQPANETNPHDAEVLSREFSRHPGRFAFLGGGGSLNRIIQKAVIEGSFDEDEQRFFVKRAGQLLSAGARGFGEIALDKFALGVDGVVYQHAPANHPLLLLLGDLAAEHGVPIVVHMEPIMEETPRPEHLAADRHPDVLQPNLATFEHLLAHNRRANIIWAHLGDDFVKGRVSQVLRRLIEANSNLYFAFTAAPRKAGKLGSLVDEAGAIKPIWLHLIQSFPEHFLLGSGQFYLPRHGTRGRIHADYKPKAAQPVANAAANLLNGLPPELARKVGRDNALRLYGLAD